MDPLDGGRDPAFFGFPAHAGMDPEASDTRWSRGWFPRPRGDGPHGACNTLRKNRVSPPTRGWTFHIGRDSMKALGFPAHAGMDHMYWP